MFFYFIICYIILAYYYISVLSLQYTIILLLYYSIILLCFFLYSLFFVICYLLSVICYLHYLSFYLYLYLYLLYFIFIYHLFFILYSLFFIYIYIYKRREEKKEKQRKIKIKEVKKKFQKSVRPKIFKIAYFLAFFSVFLFFGSAIYYLLFHRSMRAFFALKQRRFWRCFSPLFAGFLSALLSYVRNCAAWRMPSCSTYPPPYTGGAEISLTPKKIFLFFFNIDIWRIFFYFFFTFWHIVMVDRCFAVWCYVSNIGIEGYFRQFARILYIVWYNLSF